MAGHGRQGFSALFGTPIGAAVFAMEVESVGVMYYSAIVPCFLSALVAKWVASALGIAATGFTLASAPHLTPVVLLQLLALGVLCAFAAALFCEAMEQGANYTAVFSTTAGFAWWWAASWSSCSLWP